MKIIFYIGLAISATSIANAATVVWSAYYDTGIIDAGPATSAPALATGNWVQIGYFSGLTDSQIQADALSVSGTAILAAAFQTFGQLQINTNNSYSNQFGNGVGNFSATSNLSVTSNPGFKGAQIYIWALNSTNNTSLSTAEATVTQQAIAYVPLSISTPTNATQPWEFPTSDNLGGTTIDITSLQTPGSKILAGSYVSGANNAALLNVYSGYTNALQLATVAGVPPVPEASTFTVGLLAALAASGIRTRRRA